MTVPGREGGAPRASWTRDPPASWPGDARELAARLRRVLAGEVGFAAGDRALYATDASNYRQVPIGVVWPRSLDDVLATVETCRAFEAPLLNRGGGTSLAGQCCNVAVVVDWSRHLHRVLDVDPVRKLARVQPGLVLDDLLAQTVPLGLAYGADPATHDHCTFGGMLGNNSCGVHSVIAGRAEDNVEEMEVLAYDGTRLRVGATSPAELARIVAGGGRRGEIYAGLARLAERHQDAIRERFPALRRLVSGYALPELLPENGFHVARSLVGSEGTLATVLEATVRLVDWPASRALLVLGFADVFAAADATPSVLEHGPMGLEGVDEGLLHDNERKDMNRAGRELLPGGQSFLLVELGGATPAEAAAAGERARAATRGLPGLRGAALLRERREQTALWHLRESGLGATARVPGLPDTWEGWEDAAVPPERLGIYLRELRRLFDEYGYRGDLYGHFGEGCVHTRVTFDLYTAPGLATFRRFLEDAADVCLGLGGSLSGEHGDGQSRAELLPKMFGDEVVGAFRELKALWDPTGKMNPGKVCDPYPILSNLRLGTGYRPALPATVFRFPEDDGQLARAALRCVGVGTCRRVTAEGTMCPSYRVTRDERHSTRGRARLLHEMLVGEVVDRGWRSEEVREALDLCLACKACKSECPVQVDMATYKAEFLHHYYRGRLRPRAAYAMGLVHWWARMAARAPRLVNALLARRPLARLAQGLGGLAPERRIPTFATTTFRARFARRPRRRSGAPVMLYPDTFTDFFEPDVAEAAVEVLEAAGFAVELPPRRLCCGRPLYDQGFLPLARRLLRRNVEALRETARRGVPIVGLEPSCVATFRDELGALLPGDLDARRLGEGFHTLAEVLARHAPRWTPPPLPGRAVLHLHCHQRAVLDTEPDRELLARLGLEVDALDAGCCGLAGSFGFERDHYEVSMACGEQRLLPAVRGAAADDLVVADGFSCRTQIAHGTGRRALHLAQVLRQALHAARPPDLPTTEERHVANQIAR